MVVSLKVQAILVIVTAIIFMLGLFCAQIYQRKQAKEMVKSQCGIIGSLVLFYFGFVFINSYQYVMSILLAHIFDFTPVFLSSDVTEVVFAQDWFIMVSIMILGFIVNLFMVAYTKAKYLFLAPFELMLMSFTMVLFFKFSALSVTTSVMLGGVILGTLMSLLPYGLTKLCGSDLYHKTTLGTFNYLGYYIAVWVGKMFGRCETSCLEYSKTTTSPVIKRPIKFIFIGMFLLSMFVVQIANAKGFDKSMRLIILDRIAVEGFTLHAINIIGLMIGMSCLFVSYKIFITWYKDIVEAIQGRFKQVVVCTDLMYQFQKCTPYIFIGFFMSLLGCLVSFGYMSFYQFDMVCFPNLILIGVIGILVAKMGDLANGLRGAVVSCFINGIVLTVLPTLTYLAFQTTSLEFYFSFVDYYFVAQLLDILFIF